MTTTTSHTTALDFIESRAVLGEGLYSVVYEGTREDTVIKVTTDMAYYDFIRSKGSRPGLPKLIEDYGIVYAGRRDKAIVEIQRLMPLCKWDHESLLLESQALHHFIQYRLDIMAKNRSQYLCQYDAALRDVGASGMFTDSTAEACVAIAEFIAETDLDISLDLQNPANFMTDGAVLIITDPITVFR